MTRKTREVARLNAVIDQTCRDKIDALSTKFDVSMTLVLETLIANFCDEAHLEPILGAHLKRAKAQIVATKAKELMAQLMETDPEKMLKIEAMIKRELDK